MATPTPVAPERDLDDALEAIFDAPSTPPQTPKHTAKAEEPSTPTPTPPPPPPPTCIPATPEASPKKPRQKSILEHLTDNSKRLTAGAARIAEDLRKLSESQTKDDDQTSGVRAGTSKTEETTVPKRMPIAQEMAARRNRPKKQPTKDAFAVVGREKRLDGTAHATKTYEYVDNNVTNMRLTEAPYEKARLEAIFEHIPRLDIADIRSRCEELHSGALKDYTVYACLVKKIYKKQTKNGKMFAMWALCNMPRGRYDGTEVPPTVVRLLVFDDAYEAFHTRCEGTVFALRRPTLLPKLETERERASHVLRISKKGDIVVLGACKDFKLCETKRQNGVVCGQWYHAQHMTNCPKHTKARLNGLTTGTRMDIQNAVRPNLKDPTKALRIPMDISAMGGDMESTQTGQIDRKRKLDLQRARGIKKRGKEQKRERAKMGTTRALGNVQGGVRTKVPRLDPKAIITRDARPGRNRYGERHSRLLGRSDRQIRYHEACETLYALGFKLRADGGWDPAGMCNVTMVTTCTHMFSGLGKVQRRSGSELDSSKEEMEGSAEGSRNETDSAEDVKQENRQTGEEIEQGDEVKTEVDGGNADGEARKDSPDASSNQNDNVKMEMDVGETADETKADTPDVAKTLKDEARATPATNDEDASTENAEDIVLSDESEDD